MNLILFSSGSLFSQLPPGVTTFNIPIALSQTKIEGKEPPPGEKGPRRKAGVYGCGVAVSGSHSDDAHFRPCFRGFHCLLCSKGARFSGPTTRCRKGKIGELSDIPMSGRRGGSFGSCSPIVASVHLSRGASVCRTGCGVLQAGGSLVRGNAGKERYKGGRGRYDTGP